MFSDNYEAIIEVEKELNAKYKEQDQFITLMDVYDELGIDTSWYRFLISENRMPEYAWNKGVFGFVPSIVTSLNWKKDNFMPIEEVKE